MEQFKIRPMKKPDNDNIVKVVQDALNLVAYHDDVQVVDCQLRKFYSENPRVVVTIQEAPDVVCRKLPFGIKKDICWKRGAVDYEPRT